MDEAVDKAAQLLAQGDSDAVFGWGHVNARNDAA